NARVIFETLNARGTALRASDLIKNAIFGTLQDAGRSSDELYTQYWEPLEADDWQKEVRHGRCTRPRLDVYLGFFLTIFLQREIQSHQLFTAARAFFGNDADRAEAFLIAFARYAKVYDDLSARRVGTEAEIRSLARMDIADTQTVTPVLMWLFANTRGRERSESLAMLESYLVRRALCRVTSKNYNRLFLELLRKLASDQGSAP